MKVLKIAFCNSGGELDYRIIPAYSEELGDDAGNAHRKAVNEMIAAAGYLEPGDQILVTEV